MAPLRGWQRQPVVGDVVCWLLCALSVLHAWRENADRQLEVGPMLNDSPAAPASCPPNPLFSSRFHNFAGSLEATLLTDFFCIDAWI